MPANKNDITVPGTGISAHTNTVRSTAGIAKTSTHSTEDTDYKYGTAEFPKDN
jgi:hypothetical protein